MFIPVDSIQRCLNISQFQPQSDIMAFKNKVYLGRVKTEEHKSPEQEPEDPFGLPGYKLGQNQGHNQFLGKDKKLLRFFSRLFTGFYLLISSKPQDLLFCER